MNEQCYANMIVTTNDQLIISCSTDETAALFILTFKERYKLCQKAMTLLVNQFLNWFSRKCHRNPSTIRSRPYSFAWL